MVKRTMTESKNMLKHQALNHQLIDLTGFIEQQKSLDECLQDIAIMAAEILQTQNCSIMLLKDDEDTGEITLRIFAHSGYLPDVAHREARKIKESISGHVVSTGEPLFVEDINRSQFSHLKRGRYTSKGFIAVPIKIYDKVIGVINANTPLNRSNIERKDLELLTAIALLIGKSIQVIQLQSLLRSKYALYALGQVRGTSLSVSVHQSPDKIAKILAKTFYNEMSKAGFGPDHMLTTAAEIVSLLSDKLKKHRDRLNRSKNHDNSKPE